MSRDGKLAMAPVEDGLAALASVLKRHHEQNFIYVMQDGAEVKIGRSKAPYSRLSNIRSTGRPKTKLVAVWDFRGGTNHAERILHRVLAPYRTSGEWYNISATFAVKVVTDAAESGGAHRIQDCSEKWLLTYARGKPDEAISVSPVFKQTARSNDVLPENHVAMMRKIAAGQRVSWHCDKPAFIALKRLGFIERSPVTSRYSIARATEQGVAALGLHQMGMNAA